MEEKILQTKKNGMTMLLLTLLIAAAALILDVAKAAFDIAWKISHDRKDDDNKKD